MCFAEELQALTSWPHGEELGVVDVGSGHACGLRRGDGTMVCWGEVPEAQAIPNPFQSYTDVSVSNTATCGLRLNGTAHCWGTATSPNQGPALPLPSYDDGPPPDQTFVQLQLSGNELYLLTSAGTVLPPTTKFPGTNYAQISCSSTGGDCCGVHSCARFFSFHAARPSDASLTMLLNPSSAPL